MTNIEQKNCRQKDEDENEDESERNLSNTFGEPYINRRRMPNDKIKEPLYNLEYSYFPNPMDEDRFVVVRKAKLSFRALDEFIYELMERAGKGAIKIRHIAVYLEDVDINVI